MTHIRRRKEAKSREGQAKARVVRRATMQARIGNFMKSFALITLYEDDPE